MPAGNAVFERELDAVGCWEFGFYVRRVDVEFVLFGNAGVFCFALEVTGRFGGRFASVAGAKEFSFCAVFGEVGVVEDCLFFLFEF